MTTPTISLDARKLSPAAQRMHDKVLGPVRDKVIAGELTPADFQDARADILAYLAEVFTKRGMWA
jgi:hypothetical protein